MLLKKGQSIFINMKNTTTTTTTTTTTSMIIECVIILYYNIIIIYYFFPGRSLHAHVCQGLVSVKATNTLS